MAIFARVVETHSFSAAARALGLSKSAVSKQIARLERDLGVRLLNRTTRRLSLTEAGTAFYEGCQRMVAEAEAATRTVTHLAAAPRGVLRVNAPMSFGIRHVGPALPAFMERYPELAVEMVLNDRMVNLVEEGFDVGIRIARLADSTLVARRLAPSRRILCASPAYLARRDAPRDIEDLRTHDCLLYSYLQTGNIWRFAGPDGVRRVRVSGRLRTNNGDTLLAAACGGMGIALLPTFICGDDIRAGRLVRVLPLWSDPDMPFIHAVYPAHRNLSPKVRVFVDFLAMRFAPAPYWDEGLTA
ncbi:MAG: LysR family transcriptional regulator [Alphaproteobacteria bacterium]|nr:MAG: LysR family transcriptional regulator [Alphaproteobacteria bacterium]